VTHFSFEFFCSNFVFLQQLSKAISFNFSKQKQMCCDWPAKNLTSILNGKKIIDNTKTDVVFIACKKMVEWLKLCLLCVLFFINTKKKEQFQIPLV
jgi:hypothetical protein